MCCYFEDYYIHVLEVQLAKRRDYSLVDGEDALLVPDIQSKVVYII